MEIIDKCITHKSLKERRSMFTISKTPDLASNYSSVRKTAASFKTDELEALLDACAIMDPIYFELHIKAIKDELELRKTSLGKELL